MNPFWSGAIWASGFWILVYMIAVFIWAFVDARGRGAEMMNTEAANDRVSGPTKEECLESIKKYGVQHPLNAGPWNDALPRDGMGRFLLSKPLS